MKALIAIALVATSVPALAAAEEGQTASSSREKKLCTRVERRGGSRIALSRVCLTAAEWRERLGPDWREHMSGTPSVEEQMADVETKTRHFTDVSTPGSLSREAPR
jgi:hypothetical protein